jgi:hypothetical protein
LAHFAIGEKPRLAAPLWVTAQLSSLTETSTFPLVIRSRSPHDSKS